jgi:hypothetical protein
MPTIKTQITIFILVCSIVSNIPRFVEKYNELYDKETSNCTIKFFEGVNTSALSQNGTIDYLPSKEQSLINLETYNFLCKNIRKNFKNILCKEELTNIEDNKTKIKLFLYNCNMCINKKKYFDKKILINQCKLYKKDCNLLCFLNICFGKITNNIIYVNKVFLLLIFLLWFSEFIKKSIIIIRINKLTKEIKSDDVCSICLDDYKEPSKVIQLECSHLFHYNCIYEWIFNKNSCPICRKTIFM